MALKNRRQRRRRHHCKRIAHYRLVDRENPLAVMLATDIHQRFRFRLDSVLFIVYLPVPILQRETLRSFALTPVLQVLLTLRFYITTGGFYWFVADTFSNISPPSVCRAVKNICQCLCHISKRFIKMPTGNHADNAKGRFFSVCDRIHFHFI